MREVAFQGTPTEVRQLAEFLTACANLMEQHGADFGHEHFRDFITDFKDGDVDFVVAR